jgi:plasmid stabilization system protein ParE
MLRWTEEAIQQLQQIRDYISKDNARAARQQIMRIVARAESLTLPPLTGVFV